MRVVGTATEVHSYEGLRADVLRLHVQCGTEGTGAVGRRSDTALYLHRLHAGGKVAHVDPVELCALGIVHGYAVGRDVDARRVGAAHAERRVAYAVAGVRGQRYGGGQRQQVGHVLSVVHLLQLFTVHVGEGHGRLLRGADGGHLHILQLDRLQRVHGLYRVNTCCPQCDNHQNNLFHLLYL